MGTYFHDAFGFPREGNTVKTPDPRISLRPQAATLRPVTSVATFQGPQLESPSIPFCQVWVGSYAPLTLWSP
eukprot:65317-Pelagomonas_calceolata.AAC.1